MGEDKLRAEEKLRRLAADKSAEWRSRLEALTKERDQLRAALGAEEKVRMRIEGEANQLHAELEKARRDRDAHQQRSIYFQGQEQKLGADNEALRKRLEEAKRMLTRRDVGSGSWLEARETFLASGSSPRTFEQLAKDVGPVPTGQEEKQPRCAASGSSCEDTGDPETFCDIEQEGNVACAPGSCAFRDPAAPSPAAANYVPDENDHHIPDADDEVLKLQDDLLQAATREEAQQRTIETLGKEAAELAGRLGAARALIGDYTRSHAGNCPCRWCAFLASGSSTVPAAPSSVATEPRGKAVTREDFHCSTCGGKCDGPCEEGDEEYEASTPASTVTPGPGVYDVVAVQGWRNNPAPANAQGTGVIRDATWRRLDDHWRFLDDLNKRVAALAETLATRTWVRENFVGVHPAEPPQPAPAERHAFVPGPVRNAGLCWHPTDKKNDVCGQPRSAAVHGEGK